MSCNKDSFKSKDHSFLENRGSSLLRVVRVMGRQKGDPNRTKTRPSSSRLAASLLQTSNTGSIGFGGYIGSAQLVPTHASEKGRLGDIAGEAALHFRRLSKKDPTTKLKALEGMGTFIKECTVDEISQLLPHWIIQYKCLVVDNSRQVRESTNDVMAKFAVAAGRELAPHLRAFMGAWWVSQFDPTSNVSEAAKRSFQVAFPDPIKRVEALRFTAVNIFMYLDDSLKLTPQSISDKSLPMDEALERLELVLSSSLLAFATLLDILLVASLSDMPSTSDTGNLNNKSCVQSNTIVRERAAKLCISHNFFKTFTRSKTPQVRSAAYQALRALIQNLSEDFVSENLRPVASSILESFGEKDPSCHTAMWDMVLLLVKRFSQAWKFVQVKKVILPRLWALLRHGCYGSGRVSYPCLLPLVSLIPVDTVEPTPGFFSDFFCNLWKGHTFCLFAVQDTDALLKAFKECFLWIMNTTTRYYMDGMRADQIQDLLLDVLLNLLWHTYVFGGKSFQNSKNQNGFATCEKHPKQNLEDSSTVHEQIHKGAEKIEGKDKLPDQFIGALGVCIIELLDAISAKDLNLLRKLWSILEDDCIHLITNQAMSGEKLLSLVNDCVYRISHFFSKLAQILCKGEQMQCFLGWMATSFVAKLFPTVSSLEFSPGIDLLATIVSTCGPMSFGSLKVLADSMNTEERDKENYDIARDVFKNKVIPWCLGTKGDSTLSKINLLLSFFENESFRSEWCHVITFATMVTVDENGTTVLENEKLSILATLIESFRQKYVQLEEKGDPTKRIQLLQQWEMSNLEAAILTLAGNETLASPACLPLLRNSLGGEERHSPSLLSLKTTELVLDLLLRRMLLAVTESGVRWALYAASLILHSNESAQSDPYQKGSSLESARVVLQAIGNSIYCLASVDLAGGHDIVARVLATIFFIDWLYNMPRVRASLEEKDRMDAEDAENGDFIFDESVNVSFTGSDETGSYLDDYSSAITETKAEKDLLILVLKSIFGKTNSSFFRSLTKHTRVLLCQTLIQCVKFIVLENTGIPFDIAVICTEWMMDVLRYTCHEKEEIDHVLDLLFEQNMHWPFWTTLRCSEKGLAEIAKQNPSQMQVEKHARFVSFIDRIIFALGWDIIFSDFVPEHLNENEKGMEFEDWQALVADCGSSYRVCILIELLCTWNWPGGNAMHSVLPFLQSCALQAVGNRGRYLVDAILHSLFVAAVTRNNGSIDDQQNFWMCVNHNVEVISEPYLRALVVLINGLLQPAGYWGKLDTIKLYKELILEQNLTGNSTLEIAPFIVTVLSPMLRRQELCTCNEVENDFIMDGLSSFQESACHWLEVALSGPPLSSCASGSVHEKRIQMAVSHFPFHPAGGATTIAKASLANISIEEKRWLFKLLRKQASREAIAAYHAHAAESRALQEDNHTLNFPDKTTELTLAKLVATVTAYCWEYFEVEDWKFVISLLHKWLDAAVIDIEETTEAIADAVREEDNPPEENNILIDSIISKIVHLVSLPRIKRIEPTLTGIDIFSLIQSLENKDATEASAFRGHLGEINWKKAEIKATENILRLFFATGLAESIAVDSIAGEGAGKIYSFSRKHGTHLWERIAEIAVNVSDDVKKAAADSIDIWGIGKGAIRALYALLLTSFPIPSLQWAAYRFLLSGPFQESAVVQEDPFLHKKEQIEEELERSSSLMLKLRSELSSILDISPSKLFESELTSSVRVCYLLGWAIFLTRLNSFLGDLAAGESLIQYVQDSSSPSTLLDFLLHYIPVKSESKSSGTRGKGLAAQDKTDNLAAAASRAAASGSISFAIEGLWPVDKDSISILAGAVYGLILRVLPARARVWFTSLRDRSTAAAIEAFTMANCSPHLLMDEYSEVQNSVIADESLTVKANRSTREITASYKKEEAGMDMIIKLPACYPLRPVEVDCTKRLGISENRLRKWMLSMAAFLRNQNGAVARAIQIWKQNVDREFDGVEECPICYSIIHTINHSLPRLACKTCKHKFHGACLYKWFSTSHKSTCPLCQTPF